MGVCQCDCKRIVYYGTGERQQELELDCLTIIKLPDGSSEGTYSLFSQKYYTHKTIIFFHGNAENALQSRYFTDIIQEGLEVNLIIAQYPGYGVLKDTEPSESLIKYHAELLYQNTVQRVGEHNILVVGRSLGSGPASHLAGKYKPAGIVLISPFVSLQEVAIDHAKCLGYFLRDSFNNLASLISCSCPMLLIHGLLDEIVNVKHSRVIEEFMLQNGKAVTAVYPERMTHNRFKIRKDVVLPIRKFTSEVVKWSTYS